METRSQQGEASGQGSEELESKGVKQLCNCASRWKCSEDGDWVQYWWYKSFSCGVLLNTDALEATEHVNERGAVAQKRDHRRKARIQLAVNFQSRKDSKGVRCVSLLLAYWLAVRCLRASS